MRPPDELIDAYAASRGLVSPVAPHFPFTPADVAAMLALRDADWREELHRQRPPRGEEKPR